MADHIRYDLLTQQALRGVVRNVLTDAAKKGLPGEHHFYIAFDTARRGRAHVGAAARAISGRDDHHPAASVLGSRRSPSEGFEVGLSFGGIPEMLGVPFAAINGFFIPSVQFGLQFEEIGEGQAAQGTAANADEKDRKKPLPAACAPKEKPKEKAARPAAPPPATS